MSDSEGCLFYSIELEGLKTAAYSVITEVYDAQERLVAQAKGLTGEIRVTNPNLWWPRGMNKSVGYLYTLKVENKMPVSQKMICFPKMFLFLSTAPKRFSCGTMPKTRRVTFTDFHSAFASSNGIQPVSLSMAKASI